MTQGVYGLVSNFVAGDVATTPTTPGTGDEVADLQAEVAQVGEELDAAKSLLRLIRGVPWGTPLAVDLEAALESSRAGCVRPKRSRSAFIGEESNG